MRIELNYFDYLILTGIGLVVLFFLVYLVVRYIKRPSLPSFSRAQIQKKWQEIEELINKDSASYWQLAIMEADKLLDYTLKSLGIAGETMGERLKVVSVTSPKIRQVWWAHKIRNRLVHETDFELDKNTARAVILQFKKTLKDLRVL
ncbi:MAG: hypothetical protein WC480_03510 [Patescibacteria group bacterium]